MSQLAAALARIRARDPAVRGWAYLDPDPGSGGDGDGDGPLAGVTVGVKDVIDVAGMPTTHGSPICAGNVATRDADAVARLRAAGAIMLGKTVTAEFATYSPGPTVNPRRPGHTPGGSSSGSAAVVADGQADISLGTQTAGSMIRPASYCGILGFKPSFGRYPLAGVLTTAPSLDTLGLFARNLDLLVAADAVLAGCQASLPAARAPVIALCRTPAWAQAEPAMQEALSAFADRLRTEGAIVRALDLPQTFEQLAAAQTLIHRHEASRALGWIVRDHPDGVTALFRAFIAAGERDSETEYRSALALQTQCRALLPHMFDQVDLLLTPGAPGPAPAGLQATGNPAFQRIWTAVGTPCLGFPAAWTDDGLPLGLQLIARPSQDRQLLAQAGRILGSAAFKEV